MWTGLVWLRIGTGGESSCEFDIEPSGSIKCWESYQEISQLVASRVVLSSIELVSWTEKWYPKD
jgi:hypothetical protein